LVRTNYSEGSSRRGGTARRSNEHRRAQAAHQTRRLLPAECERSQLERGCSVVDGEGGHGGFEHGHREKPARFRPLIARDVYAAKIQCRPFLVGKNNGESLAWRGPGAPFLVRKNNGLKLAWMGAGCRPFVVRMKYGE
jgi:hypothetical protein